MDTNTFPAPEGIYRELSPEVRQQLLRETVAGLSPGDDFWVFGFGSLMWNPCYSFDQQCHATLQGYERKFHIWTSIARGTPEHPGLGLCLEKTDGECQGIAYRLLPETLEQDMDALWFREMTTGIYRPTWLEAKTPQGQAIRVLTFVVDPNHRQYAGALPLETMATIIAGAEGRYGKNVDYLANTIEEMAKLDVHDPELDQLLALVRAREAELLV